MIQNSLNLLKNYCEKSGYKGYDPYDMLNSYINFKIAGRWLPIFAIQLHKRNPINLRPLLGIKKEINPKAFGLLLKAYCILYNKTGNSKYLEKAHFLFQWLINNYSKGYAGHAWGYNFDWASTDMFLPAYTPSVVVTSFVVDGIFEYYNLTKDEKALKVINSASHYIIKDIPVSKFDNGIVYSYTHIKKDCCYNASLLAAEVLAKVDAVNKTKKHSEIINMAIDFVLSKQHPDGEWWYSFNQKNNTERKQIDFHQGFILVSLGRLNSLLTNQRLDLYNAIERGLNYYKTYQFLKNGQSLWRIPKIWPTDIHNQTQGIITFSKLKAFHASYLPFAKRIADWTIENMQDKSGYFFYRKNPIFTNKIPYMRWSQAWMFLALVELIISEVE